MKKFLFLAVLLTLGFGVQAKESKVENQNEEVKEFVKKHPGFNLEKAQKSEKYKEFIKLVDKYKKEQKKQNRKK